MIKYLRNANDNDIAINEIKKEMNDNHMQYFCEYTDMLSEKVYTEMKKQYGLSPWTASTFQLNVWIPTDNYLEEACVEAEKCNVPYITIVKICLCACRYCEHDIYILLGKHFKFIPPLHLERHKGGNKNATI